MTGRERRKAQRTDRIIIAVLLIAAVCLIAWIAAGSGKGSSGGAEEAASEVTYEDYNGKKIGILTGTNMEQASFEYFPDSEYFYYDGYPNMNAALENGMIDAYLGDEPALKSIHAEQPQIDYIKDRLTDNRYSFAFRKNDPDEKKLLDQFNEFLRGIKADGTYDDIDATWFGIDEDKKVVDMSDLTGENGTIRVITTSTDEPFSYIKDGKNVGYDIDVAVRFCRAYGYAVKIVDVDFQARIPALDSGQGEFTTTMNVTPEREEAVLFSEPVSEGGIVVAVRSEDLAGTANASDDEVAPETGFLEGIANSFEKTFIRENRWKLILQGMGTTCLITALSAFFGTLLAFGVCMFRRTRSNLANRLSDGYVRILQGTPMVVVLMILYYVIFGKMGVKPIWVAVIGFTLNLGAYGSEIMRSGIESIDRGQWEAALALGYSERQAFFDFIFPQAAVRFLPVYRGELVSLLKSTSIVGYISIMDLTKMSDIIRSRTYDAFFPLITTALIYFALAWVITLLMKFLLNRIDWKTGRERARSAGRKSERESAREKATGSSGESAREKANGSPYEKNREGRD